MQIGKSGITAGLLRELRIQLKVKKIIKIKLMKSYIEDKNKKKELNYKYRPSKEQLLREIERKQIYCAGR